MRRSLIVAVLLMLLLSLQVAWAARPPAEDYDLFFSQVELRPGVTSDIHVKVFVNEDHPRGGKTVFAIPGWMHTAQSWDQYAEALFTHPYKGIRTSQLVAIDPPGHGLSSLPTGLLFGELLLDDFVTAAQGTLDALRARGIWPQEIMGTDLGGLMIQMLQDRLQQNGSSLLQRYGISRALLLAPSPPAGIDWHIITDGTGDLMNAWFLQPPAGDPQPPDPVLGRYYYIPAEWWGAVFFANLLGGVSPDAPTPEEVEARGYRSIDPLFEAMQATGWTTYIYDGQPYLPRPEVSPGIFGVQSGTLLHVVSYVDDTWTYPSEAEATFAHIVGSPWWSRSTVIEDEAGGQDRVHGLYISNPGVILDAMSEDGWLLW